MPPLSSSDVAVAFSAEIPKIPVTLGYRLRLLAVLSGLLLMQVLYLALVVLVIAFAIVYTISAFKMEVRINVFTLLIYLGPPAALTILTFFLMKPIFVRPEPPPEALRLTPQTEPILFQFVDRLCRHLGAPAPKVIYVDLAVNASAALRGWRGFFFGDLALTIGLPLVRGLTLPQFTGVLAHEFGHFSQRAGMRSYFLIQTIRFWFARVVHDRDHWDFWLEQGGDEEGWRMRLVRQIARGGVWISRRYLELLMKGGTWLSAEFSRQMEFDADRYETSIVGPVVFEQTTHRIPELTHGANSAWDAVRSNYQLGRLPDDVAWIVDSQTQRLPEQALEQIREEVLGAVTARFDSHPCALDRIAQSRLWGAAGCFALDGPASRIFQDIDHVSRLATAHRYRLDLGEDWQAHPLVPAGELVSAADREGLYRQALVDAGGSHTDLFDWFELPATAEAPQTPETAVGAAAFTFDRDHYAELLNGWTQSAAVVSLLDSGAQTSQDHEESRQIAEDNRQEWSRECGRLRTANRPFATKLLRAAPRDLVEYQQILDSTRVSVLDLRRLMAEVECFRLNAHLFGAAEAANQVAAAEQRATAAVAFLLDQWDALPTVVILHPASPATLSAQIRGEAGDAPCSPHRFYARWCEINIGTTGRLCWHAPSE